MRFRRRRVSDRRRQDNGRRNASGNDNFRPHNRRSPWASQGNRSGITHATNVAVAPTQPLAPSSAPGPAQAFTAAPLMRYGPAFSGNTNPNARRPGTFQVPPTPTPWLFEDSATSVALSTALFHGWSIHTSTQVTYTGPTLRPCHPPLIPEPAASDGNDPPTGTSLQRCEETGTSDTDIRVLCPSRDRPPPGHATTGVGSLGSVQAWSDCLLFTNSLLMTAVVMQTRIPSVPNPDWYVPPISSNTGPWDSGLAADSRWSHTRSCRNWTCRGDSAPFSGRRECLPKQGRRPPLIIGQLLRAPSTNA